MARPAGRGRRVLCCGVPSPLDYPFEVATTPFVVRADGVSAGGEAAPGRDTVAIVASGSNASPARLLEKLGGHLDGRAIGGGPCVVDGWTSVYSAHFTAYGALPATLDRDPGARAELVCLHLPATLLSVLHRSEALGRNYGFYRLDGGVVRNATGGVVETPHAYLSLHGVLRLDGGPRRLAAFAVDGSVHPAASERTVMASVCHLLDPELGLDEFVARLVEDGAFRAAKTAELRSRHARPLDLRGLRRAE